MYSDFMGNMSITAQISSVPKGMCTEKNTKFTSKDVYMLVVFFIDKFVCIFLESQISYADHHLFFSPKREKNHISN